LNEADAVGAQDSRVTPAAASIAMAGLIAIKRGDGETALRGIAWKLTNTSPIRACPSLTMRGEIARPHTRLANYRDEAEI